MCGARGTSQIVQEMMTIFLSRPGGVLSACAGFTGAGFSTGLGYLFLKKRSGWVGDCRFVNNGVVLDDMSRNGAAKA